MGNRISNQAVCPDIGDKTMNDLSEDAKLTIRRRIRSVMGPLLVIAMGVAVIQLSWGGFCAAQGDRGLLLLGRFILPAGWMVPLCLWAYFVGRRRLSRDLNGESLLKVSGPIYRGTLVKDFESNMPEPEQYVTSDALRGRFVIPLDFWKQMPEYSVAELEVFKHSKVVYRLNGQIAWGKK